MKKSKILATVVTAAVLSVGGAFAGCGGGHEHTYSDKWTSDAASHWHVATCDDLKEGDKDYKSDVAAHVWGDDSECDVCHYIKEVTPPATTEYTVTLNVGGGTLTGSTTLTTVNGKLAFLPTPTAPEGKKFVGWYTAVTEGTQVTTATAFTADGTIYARYVDLPAPVIEYTITLEAGEGTFPDEGFLEALKTVNGKLALLPTPTAPEGKKFVGWYTAVTEGTQVTTATEFTADGTIYAVYVDDSAETTEYTITLEVGEGTLPEGASATLETVEGKLANLPTPTAPNGKEFDGWYTAEEDGTEVTVDTVFEEDGTIYAQYVEVEPVVSVTNGETPITLVKADIAEGDTAKYKYSVEGNTLQLTEGDELTFLIDGKVPEKFGGNPSANHGVEINGNVVTANDTGTYTFYLRYYEDNDWWEVEMTDGKTDVLNDGHYYLVGGISSWKCTAKYDLGATASTESPLTVTKKFVAGAEFKITTYSVTKDTENDGTPSWDNNATFGSSAVNAGLGYLRTGDNIIIDKAGTYTIEFDGTNVKISTEDFEEPELDLDYSAKITFKDGVKATIVFTLPQSWDLGSDLNTGFIKIGDETINIKPSGSVTYDASDIDVSEPITVYGGFKQGGATWSVNVENVTIEDGATYKLVFGGYKSESGGIKYASCTWEKIG